MIYNGSCLNLLLAINNPIQLIIADPPDNLGLDYGAGFVDKMPDAQYYQFLREVMLLGVRTSTHFWLSYYWRHDLEVSKTALELVQGAIPKLDWKKYIWRYTFGQHRESDCGSGFRYLLRLSKPGKDGKPVSLFTSEVRQPSKRQTIYNDSRANSAGRVPDDVWDFPRVTGNSKERRAWHPTQHPVGVYARIMRLCSRPGDTVVDCFGGTGTLFRANSGYGEEQKRKCLISEINTSYCTEISKEHNLPIYSSVDSLTNAWSARG
jgi:DNA modification methylase